MKDTPPPSANIEATPTPATGGDPNLVRNVNSPVHMNSVVGTFKMRGMGDGIGGFGSKIGGNGKGGGLPEGALLGEIIDFKRDGSGKTRNVNAGGNDYWLCAKTLIESRFDPEKYHDLGYRLPMRVALSSLWIPQQDANNGPKAFGAETHMDPKAWLAHYSGPLMPVKDMRCRFIGYFDDLMIVAVDGKVVLDVNWGMKAGDASATTKWRSKFPDESRYPGPQPGCTMIVGDWVEFKDGKSVKFDIICGERPGGKIGGLLLIEEEGVEYEKMPNGRPKWPIFTTIPLSPRQKMEFESVEWGIGTNPPRFNFRKKNLKFASEGDIQVDVNL